MDILLDDIAINQEAQNRNYFNLFWWLEFGRDIARNQLKDVIPYLEELFDEDTDKVKLALGYKLQNIRREVGME